jgi:Fur family iron response transcriptional regulator
MTGRAERKRLETLLAAHGIQATAQRLRIAEQLFARNQHQTAEQVFRALGRDGGSVARATVYNTLNLFAARGLIKALAVDPERCQFDSNPTPHHHYYVEDTGEVVDIEQGALELARLPELPPGTELQGVDVIVRLRRRA